MHNETILHSSSGLFGPITICDYLYPATRSLKINTEIEGQVFKSPDAFDFSIDAPGPGPVAASCYLYAFILLAWQFPASHGLILGLGAGIGATMLLSLFPDLVLTVVEIDRQVIESTRHYFPLVSFFEKQGRLKIEHADAEIYIDNCRQSFSFTLLDIFSGDENSIKNLNLITKSFKLSPYFMSNLITSKITQAATEQSIDCPNSGDLMWLAANPPVSSSEKINWMLTNLNILSPEVQNYQLFSLDLQTHPNVITANGYFRYILSQVDAACFYR